MALKSIKSKEEKNKKTPSSKKSTTTTSNNTIFKKETNEKQNSKDKVLIKNETKKDNTYVKKPYVDSKQAPKPSYKYVEADVNVRRAGKPYTKKDSADYKISFQNEMGVKGLANKSFFNGYSPGRLEAKELKQKKKIFIKK